MHSGVEPDEREAFGQRVLGTCAGCIPGATTDPQAADQEQVDQQVYVSRNSRSRDFQTRCQFGLVEWGSCAAVIDNSAQAWNANRGDEAEKRDSDTSGHRSIRLPVSEWIKRQDRHPRVDLKPMEVKPRPLALPARMFATAALRSRRSFIPSQGASGGASLRQQWPP